MNALTTPAQVEADRSQFIGGSDIAAIVGVSPWKTPVQLWLEKTGQHTEPVSPEKQKLFNRGKRWEPIASDMLVDVLREQGHQVEVIAENRRYTDPDVPFLQCEIDREFLIDGEHCNGEIKTVHPFASKDWGDMDTDEVPVYYATQALFGLGLTGRERCVVGCLIGADSMTPYWVHRDDITIDAMRGKAIAFWRHVVDGIAPDPQNFADLKHLFRRDNGLAIAATDEIATLVYQLGNIKASLKSYKIDEERIQFEIENYIRPHSRLTYEGRDIATLKQQEQTRFDEKLFALAHPELAAKFKRTIDFRVLRLKKGI